MSQKHNSSITRRGLLRITGAAIIAGITGTALYKSRTATTGPTVWQIDHSLCIYCGRCATECVLTPSAAKCFHAVDVCGYCDLCFGFFDPTSIDPYNNAEDITCPYNAIQRHHIEDVHYEYKIDQELCVGCAKCVEGCTRSGNGSFYLQLDRDLCANCNECRIARECPANAITRIPAEEQYILKGKLAKEKFTG